MPEVSPGPSPAGDAAARPESERQESERQESDRQESDRQESRRGARRRDLAAAVLAVTAIVGFVAVKGLMGLLAPRPTEAQCAELVDRYLEHASRARDPRINADDIAQATERSRTKPARSADLKACRDQLSAAQVECGLKSPNVDDMERCLQ